MDMNQIMAQARKMQAELASAQDSLKQMEATGTAGGGAVRATVSGDLKLTSLTIDPAAVDPDDVELLQDMVVAAVNDAIGQVNDAANAQMSSITGGLNIPGLM
ncbi:MAG: YbaB/EbfC family nucleoid-associated protein [Atopobiaceae bacterium]|jgi:DNA-binding YbaB/EbfC family protein|uniref:Nucleoid-associated protein VXJ25_05840 n=1 Tax=Olsenella absiana TaxID=3115222 RepID=A0ABU7RA92_9ACTN|nr:YbaB/EbfC family nucleoid-associated protein [Olsenella sp.]MDD7364875.1 YbaB/EbfC family nucleoid-associated protein [Olsenella sp.]MDY3901327.1 YbaB/EbfC family nucleoid-associated protein [Atopobiaceae bacterium]